MADGAVAQSDVRDRRPHGRLRSLLSPRQEALEALFDTVYRGLGVGIATGIAGAAPFTFALTVLARPLEAWPFLLVCALPIGPAIAAAFAVFGGAASSDRVAPFRDFVRAWRTLAMRALGIWAAFTVVLFVLIVDAGVIWGTVFAALIGPVTAVIAVVVAAGTLHSLAVLASRPGVGAVTAARTGLFLAVRRPLPTLLSLVILLASAMVVLAQPVLGVLGLGGFALLVLHANSAAALASVAPAADREPADPAE
ncbi:DUF624 domain-containing protein [Agromyces sp. Soil535]|uniref:DUF624 domain-containing protein n=1 Tax=Agromyces sp. Soil535 TaxID=1736390 RepID=UPI00138F099E|nr:DUF624 domain-containing protein [Agromyces sp. Soil535]